jgi:hypothetical protein
MLLLGKSVGLEELPETVNPAPEVPAWPTENANGPHVVLILMVWLAIDDMVGGASGAFSIIVTV